MRAALISLAGSQAAIAGRTLALRQLDFALAAGCARVFAVGDGASPEALALTHAAERAGARCQAIRNARGLLGTLTAADELLVMSPGLLPEAGEALERLAAPGVLVLPAAAGVAAGFERIDLERASAGALVVSGAVVERLAELPADSEPGAALLRLALQARVPERRLPESVLAEGSWALAGDEAAAAALGGRWLSRHIPPVARYALSARAARAMLRPLALRLLGTPGSVRAIAAAAVALQVGAVALCAWVSPVAGFALLALGVICAGFGQQLRWLATGPFASKRVASRAAGLSGWLSDAALAACGALAIPGDLLYRLFAPLVLVGTLRASGIAGWPNAAAMLGDRALLALLLAAAAGLGHVEPAIMLAGLAILLLQAARPTARGG